MKLVTFINLELILCVLFAMVVLVGPMGYVRILVQFAIVIFMIFVFVYYIRDKKKASGEASKDKVRDASKKESKDSVEEKS